MKHWVVVGQSPVSRVLVLDSDIIQFSYMQLETFTRPSRAFLPSSSR